MNRITISAAIAAAACGIAVPTVSALASSGAGRHPSVRTPVVRLVDDHGRTSSSPGDDHGTEADPGHDHGGRTSTASASASESGDDHGSDG